MRGHLAVAKSNSTLQPNSTPTGFDQIVVDYFLCMWVKNSKQECIPVGCVQPAAVAVWEGLPQCMLGSPLGVGLETPPPRCGPGDLPQLWAWRPPPSCGPGNPHPPQPDPSTSPLGVGLETCCKACWDTTCNACCDTTSPWRPAARHAGIPPAMHAGIPPPPLNRITDTCKNITLSQLRCGR